MRHPILTAIWSMSLLMNAAMAQDSPPQDLPKLELSQQQRQTIYLSVTNQPDMKGVAPPTFRAALGAHLPDVVKVEPMPKTIVELMPQTKGYEVAYIATQVLIIEPKSKRVVDVIVNP